MSDKSEKVFFYVALSGFILSFLVHIISLSGINLQEKVPFVMVLHIVVFVAFIPAVLKMNKIQREG